MSSPLVRQFLKLPNMHAIQQIKPGDLQSDMQRLSGQLQTYSQAQTLVMDQEWTLGSLMRRRRSLAGFVPRIWILSRSVSKTPSQSTFVSPLLTSSTLTKMNRSDAKAELNGLRKDGFPSITHVDGQFGRKICECRKKK